MGSKENRRKTSLSVWHCLASPGTGVCFNSKFPNAIQSWQRLAGSPTLYKLISNLLHPSSSISYTPTIPTPLLSSRRLVSFSERKKKLTFFNLSLKHTPVYSYLHPVSSLLLSKSGRCWSSQLSGPSAFTFSGNYTINYLFSCIFNVSLSTKCIPFLWTTLSDLNGISPPHNTSLKQLSLFSNHVAQNSGHCPCMLFDFSAAWDTVKHSFFRGTRPSFDTPRPLLAVSSPRILGFVSFIWILNIRLLQDKFLGCLLLSLCTISHSNFMYLHDVNYHSYQVTH